MELIFRSTPSSVLPTGLASDLDLRLRSRPGPMAHGSGSSRRDFATRKPLLMLRSVIVALIVVISVVSADDIICGGSSCTASADWEDRIEMRFHHVSFFVSDVCAAAEFWKSTLGYKVQNEIHVPAMPPTLPCPMHAIMMTRGTGDIIDLDQFECPPGVAVPTGYIHFVHMVNNVQTYHNKMAALHVPIARNMSSLRVPGNHIDIECYYGPDNIEFCAAQNVGL